MGKDLKGKELGRGISQRKDKYYVGRYTTRSICVTWIRAKVRCTTLNRLHHM